MVVAIRGPSNLSLPEPVTHVTLWHETRADHALGRKSPGLLHCGSFVATESRRETELMSNRLFREECHGRNHSIFDGRRNYSGIGRRRNAQTNRVGPGSRRARLGRNGTPFVFIPLALERGFQRVRQITEFDVRAEPKHRKSSFEFIPIQRLKFEQLPRSGDAAFWWSDDGSQRAA